MTGHLGSCDHLRLAQGVAVALCRPCPVCKRPHGRLETAPPRPSNVPLPNLLAGVIAGGWTLVGSKEMQVAVFP